ncbi:hypothetical protein RhiirC2_716242 [Rhizophagus irregularis]|uniref:DNA-directed DNA polymerase n=1 Tax=Rhizophagus irregularis TaxID=588596 RepID=A0A2N1MS64_9GLOM|nr:hypothetical protein RhiirC2_716242 [Rhizophagus irregularis]
MENVRKYQDVKIMKKNNERNKKAFLKKVCKPSFKYARQLENTFIGAHMEKASITLSKPIIVGTSVLGLSKLHIYEFWYRYIKEKYGDKARLRYMDTDFYIFETETEDIYKDMAERPDLFNLNGDQAVGKFKDKTPGNVITESYHIRAKSYHYVLIDKTTKSKYKGITTLPYNHWRIRAYKNMVKDSISHEEAEKRAIRVKLPEKYQNEFIEKMVVRRNDVFRTKHSSNNSTPCE